MRSIFHEKHTHSGCRGQGLPQFQCCLPESPDFRVVAFTATQIPDIAGRCYPAALAGSSYPEGIPIIEEKDLESAIRAHHVDAVVFSYSDVSHQALMHLASRCVAAGVDFWLLGTEHTQVKSSLPVVSVCAVRTRLWQKPSLASCCGGISSRRLEAGRDPSPDAVRGSRRTSCTAFRHDE